MREFVITSPGLSIGRPGQHLTGEELRMDDDQLDAFVQAGYAFELSGSDERDRAPQVSVADDVPLAQLKPRPRPRKGKPQRPHPRPT